ncbi:hypothetical protein N9L49_01580 [Rhodospirillales bacterium]|nr:hypothetical protein [Rhodospirillales bacterium]
MIQEAFGLQQLTASLIEPAKQPGPDNGIGPEVASNDQLAEIDELSRWANGDTTMSQQLAGQLRPLVYEAVVSFINWDEIACPKTFWTGPKGVFKQNGVTFENQSTRAVAGSQISLTLPLSWNDDADRTNTFLAFSGLIEARRRGGWEYKDAYKKFVCLQECLQLWSDRIIRQISDLKPGPNGWFPASAALELSVLGVLLSTPQENIPNKIDLFELGLTPIPNETSYLSPKLEKLVGQIRDKQTELFRVIGEGVAATKGGQIGNFLNSNILIEAMKAFRGRDYKLMALPNPDDLRVPWHKDHVYPLARAVTDQLGGAITEEVEMRLSWLKNVDAAFGAEINEARIADLIRTTVTAISQLGIAGSNELQSKAGRFSEVNFTESVRVVRTLKNQAPVCPWHVATGIRAAKEISDDMMNEANRILSKAKGNIEAQLEDVGYKPDAIAELQSEILVDLEKISETLRGD